MTMTSNNYYRQGTSLREVNCRNRKNSHIALGSIIVFVGLFILGRRLGIFYMPPFRLWSLLILGVGIYSGIKHRFTNMGSWVLIAIGLLFTIPKFFVWGVWSSHLVAPVLLIVIGTYLIVRPRKRFGNHFSEGITTVDEDVVNLDVSFGDRTSVITSKNFKGGVVSSNFGSAKVNLMQADALEPMVLELKVSFASVDILVPAHWDVEFKMDNSFSSVEDKRFLRTVVPDEKRVLVLKGNCSFGSITVKSL